MGPCHGVDGGLEIKWDTLPKSVMIRYEFQLPWDLGQFSSLPFLAEEKFRVDVDLIDDTSCLHGAVSIFNAQKTDPQRSSLSGGLVQTGETLSSPVL